MSQAFRIPVAEERRHPGLQTKVRLVGPLDGIDLSSARVPQDAEVSFEGVVEAQGPQVIIQGTAIAPWEGECRRCLEATDGMLEVHLREVFESSPVEDETFPIEDDQVDLAPLLREALALALPLAPLCRPDCPGPDPEAHPVVPAEDADEAAVPRDPRWEALDELRFDASDE